MPIYEYRCENGHTFEVMQRMSDDPITVCKVCGAPVHRVFHPVAVHFKGSGFYNTDYGKQKRSGGASGSDDGGGGGGAGGDGDGKPSKDADGAAKKKKETPAPSASTSSSD
jgi:putative FmdB family regulatory protein